MRLASTPHWLALAGGASLLAACPPPAPVVEPTPPPSPAAEVREREPKPAAAGWLYHPSRFGRVLDGVPLAGGAWLLLDDLGRRWVTEPVPDAAGTGPPRHQPRCATAAGQLAPEGLRRVVRWAPDRWLFVGASGAVYQSPEPTGALALAAPAPVRLAPIGGRDRVLAGADVLGEPYRFDGDAWVRVARPVMLFELADRGDGRLLGLAIPEQLWASDDGGASWLRLDVPPLGVFRLDAAEDGAVVLHAAAGRWHLPAGASRPVPGGPEPRVLSSMLDLDRVWPRRGPSAGALVEGRAAVAGQSYFEVRERVTGPTCKNWRASDKEGWLLARGQLGGPLEHVAIPLRDRCDVVRLGAGGAQLVLLCATRGEVASVKVMTSSDGGQKWHDGPALATPDPAALAVAVASDGNALVANACPAGTRRCELGPPVRIPPGRPAKVRRAVAPGFGEDVIGALAFSLDGARAYFLGRRSKDGRLTLFVSDDGGERFWARALPARPNDPPGADSLGDREQAGDLAYDLHPGADGAVGIVLGTRPPQYVVVDEGGGSDRPPVVVPEDVVALSGAGRSVLVLAAALGVSGVAELALRESRDGGRSYRSVPAPSLPNEDELPAGSALWCAAGGCVVGDVLTRVGWAPAEVPSVPTGHLAADPAPDRPKVLTRTLLVCRSDEARPWLTVEGLSSGELPTAWDAFRGRAVWSVLQHRRATGEVVAVAGNDAGALERTPLLAPVRNRDAYAYQIAPQAEGYAAVRVPLAGRAAADLGWVDYPGATSHRGRVLLDPPRLGDSTPAPGPELLGALLSVSPRSAFVRATMSGPLWLVPQAGAARGPLAYPPWPTGELGPSDDAVHVDGVPLALGLFSETLGAVRVVGLRALAAPGAEPSYATVAPLAATGREQWVYWTARGETRGITTVLTDDAHRRALGYFVPFGADARVGAAEPVPGQLDLGETPRPCGEEERTSTLRTVAPWMLGTRHPVVVQGEAQGLVTSWAVLYGTPAAPCVAGWLADTEEGLEPGLERVALLRGDLRGGWLLRTTPAAPASIDARPLSCEPSPAASAPDWVARRRGTVAPP